MAGIGSGDGYLLDRFEAIIGDVSVKLDGHIGPLPDLQGTDLEVEARGESFLVLAPYLKMPALPDEPFAVSGGVRVEDGGYRLAQVTGELGTSRLNVDGAIGPLPALLGTDLVLQSSGDRLADVARYVAAANLGEWPPLPEDASAVSGKVSFHQSGYEIRRLEARLGEARLKVDGTLGSFPDLHGTDLVLDARGPDASFIGALAGVSLPATSRGRSSPVGAI